MMARSSTAPAIGRIQKRKTNFPQIIIFGLQRAAGPYRWAKGRHTWRARYTIFRLRACFVSTLMSVQEPGLAQARENALAVRGAAERPDQSWVSQF